MATFACPHCRANLTLANNIPPGTPIKCPQCAKGFAMPRPVAMPVVPLRPVAAPTAPRPPAARPATVKNPVRSAATVRRAAPAPRPARGSFLKGFLTCAVLFLLVGGAGAGYYFWPQLRQQWFDKPSEPSADSGQTASNTKGADTTKDKTADPPNTGDRQPPPVEPRKQPPDKGSTPEKPVTPPPPPPPVAGGVDALAFIPADSNLIAGFDGAALLALPMLKDAMDQGLKHEAAAQVVAELKRDTGLEDVKDLLGQVIVAGKVPVPDAATPPTPDISTIIIKSLRPLNRARLAKSPYLDGPYLVKGKPYYQVKKGTPLAAGVRDTLCVYLPTDRIVVLADRPVAQIEALIGAEAARPVLPPSVEGMVRRLEKNPLWVLVPFDASLQELLKKGAAMAGTTAPPPLQPAAKALENAKAAAIWLGRDNQRLTLSLAVDCGTDKAAGEVSAGLDDFWSQFKGAALEQLKLTAGKLPPEVTPILNDLLGSLRFTKQDSWAEASVGVELPRVEALAKKVQTEGLDSLKLALQGLAGAGPQPPPANGPEQRLLQLLNQQRAEAKLPPLKLDPALSTMCRSYAQLMAKQDKLADNLDGKTFQQRLDASTYKYLNAVGPLIGRAGNEKSEELVAFWIKNEQIKQLLLGKFTDCGIGIAPGAGGAVYYYVVLAIPR